jgi:hypothetical protein
MVVLHSLAKGHNGIFNRVSSCCFRFVHIGATCDTVQIFNKCIQLAGAHPIHFSLSFRMRTTLGIREDTPGYRAHFCSSVSNIPVRCN